MNNTKVLLAILIVSPLICYQIVSIQPTFDDWTYFTNPYYDFGEDIFSLLIPRASYWRPFDCLFGYLLSINDRLFPLLNHIAVYLGHLANTYLVWHLARQGGLSPSASNFSTVFFFLSPAVLGTVLGIDSLNQTYSHLWGMMAICTYLTEKSPKHLWLFFALIATLCKENGMVFFVVPQITALAFNKKSIRQTLNDTCYSIVLITIYFIVRNLLQTEVSEINEEYFENPIFRITKNIIKFFTTSFVISDYSFIVYQPLRNIPVAMLISLSLIPFYIYIFWRGYAFVRTKTFFLLLVAIITAASPHLVTLFTVMHAYAALGMISITLGFLYQTAIKHHQKFTNFIFGCFILGSVIVDWHHIQLSKQSAETGKQMALSVLKEIAPRDSVSVLYIDCGEEKYSS